MLLKEGEISMEQIIMGLPIYRHYNENCRTTASLPSGLPGPEHSRALNDDSTLLYADDRQWDVRQGLQQR